MRIIKIETTKAGSKNVNLDDNSRPFERGKNNLRK